MRIKNINDEHRKSLSFNERLANAIAQKVGTMECFYIFCIIALLSLPAAIASHNLVILIAWLSSNFLQLVLLAVIQTSQNSQNRHTELRAEHEYALNLKEDQDNQEIKEKLDLILLKCQETNGHLLLRTAADWGKEKRKI